MSREGRSAGAFVTSPLGIVFTTVVVDLIGFGIVLPLLPLYAERFGASPVAIGGLSASYAIMQFLFAPALGRLSDRVGRRPVILVSLAGTCMASLLFGLAGALWLLFVARILDGLSGASYVAAQAYVADVTAPEERAHAMGLIGAAFGVGFVLGPAIGGLCAVAGPRVPFFVAAALAATNLALAWRRLPESRDKTRTPSLSRRQVIARALAARDLAPLVWVSFIGTFAFVGMEVTFALFGERRFGFDQAQIGLVFAYIGLVTAFVQGVAIRPVVRRFGEWRVLVTGLLLTGAALALLPACYRLWELLPTLLLLAVASGLVFPTLTALVSRRTAAGDQGGVLGVLASTGSLARVLAPVVATALFQVQVAVPYLVGGALFLGCLAILRRGAAQPAIA